jgi:hypothetical protein
LGLGVEIKELRGVALHVGLVVRERFNLSSQGVFAAEMRFVALDGLFFKGAGICLAGLWSYCAVFIKN